jgi:hypothetical protein
MSASELIEGAVLVSRPVREHPLPQIGIRSSANEIPDPLERWDTGGALKLKPDGWWLAEGAFFDGRAWPINSYGELSAAQPVQVTSSTAAFCVARGRLLAIVSPSDSNHPAVWVNVACARVAVTGEREEVTLRATGWEAKVIRISRLHRHLHQKGLRPTEIVDRYQTGQARSFVDALAKSAQTPPDYAVLDPGPDAPPAGSGYKWVRQPQLGDVHRLVRMGKPTSATALVDRELAIDQQISALQTIDWVPRAMIDTPVELTRENAQPKLFRPPLPGDRVMTPFGRIYLARLLNDEPARHPISRYLWPSLGAAEPSLDAGEQLLATWAVPAVRLARYESPDDRGLGVEFDSAGLRNPRVYLTNHRMIVIGERDPAKIGGDDRRWWGVHFRAEWLSEVGVTERTIVKKAGFRQKVVGEEVSHSPYVRLVLPAGNVNEISLPDGIAAAEDFIARVIACLGARAAANVATTSVELRNGSVVCRFRSIADSVPYSLPAALEPDRSPGSGRERHAPPAESPEQRATITRPCPSCGALNRIPAIPGQPLRCGRCHEQFIS